MINFSIQMNFGLQNEFDLKINKEKKVTIGKKKIKKATNEYNWYYAIMMAILRNIELWKKGEVRRRVM